MLTTKTIHMKKSILLLIIAIMLISLSAEAQIKNVINIPDIPGYYTLTFDPHIHTVFSDGRVWPTIRVEEAWREGLDAISITDHIEYRPFQKDVVSDHNRAFELAKPLADRVGVMMIHGTEITRSMPPGHFNALFIEDANKLEEESWQDALKAAKEQNAFIIWNHPGWRRQQPDTTLWFDEHTWLLENGMMHGIEVVNGSEYYPEAHQWCLDKNLTMIGSTDIHDPISMHYDIYAGEIRPLTLVFAKEKSVEGIREALFEGRTVVYSDNKLIGRQEYLDAIYKESLQVKSIVRHNNLYSILVFNPTDIPLVLSNAKGNNPGFGFSDTTIPPGKHVNLNVFITNATNYDKIEVLWNVDNYLVKPGEGLNVKMTFIPDNL
jgi:3',5'-nucleoside bisphosphate phosphatase